MPSKLIRRQSVPSRETFI